MKEFHFTAKNERGEKITGTIESELFDEATRAIRDQGLELISLEQQEKNIIEELRPFVFEAIDKDGEEVQGTIQGADIESVKRKLHDDFGLQVTQLRERMGETHQHIQDAVQRPEREKEDEKNTSIEVSLGESSKEKAIEETKKNEPVLFSQQPRKELTKKETATQHHLNEMEESLQHLLEKKGTLLSDRTHDRLRYLQGKIELVRESQDKKRFKNLKRELQKIQKIAERELKEIEDKKWKDYEKQSSKDHISSYDEFETETKESPLEAIRAKREELREKAEKKEHTGLRKVIQIIDLPNEGNEQEVLIKQQYESVWNETERFAVVLVIFYLLTFFVSYYLKRSGGEDHFLVRIYDTTLFKQIVLLLFSFYAMLSVRNIIPSKRLKSDVLFVVAWLIISWWLLW